MIGEAGTEDGPATRAEMLAQGDRAVQDAEDLGRTEQEQTVRLVAGSGRAFAVRRVHRREPIGVRAVSCHERLAAVREVILRLEPVRAGRLAWHDMKV